MQRLLLISCLAVYAIAGVDCTVFKQGNNDFSTESYCRAISVMESALNYDRSSIKSNYRLILDKDNTEILKVIVKRNEQCYQQCILTNKKY